MESNRSYPHPSDVEVEEQATTERSLEDLHDHIVKAFNTVNFLMEQREAAFAREAERGLMHDSREETILTLNEAIAGSIIKDVPLTKEDMPSIWRDEFLTNVMVPFLEWIIEKYREMEAEFLSDISGRGRPATPEQVYSFQELLRKVNAMKTTVHVLQEWRG